MIRTCFAIVVWIVLSIVVGIPVLLAGFVYPSRWVIARSSVLWCRLMLAIAGARMTIVGEEHRGGPEPRFYMANHQSSLDIPIVVVATDGDVRFFSKSTIFRIPIFGWALWRYGFIPIYKSKPRATLAALEQMLERLKRRPISLAVFPEGTRSRDGTFSPFRGGTMKIAIRAGFPVVPIAIDGSLAVDHRDDWRLRPGPIRVTFTEPIPGSEVATMSPSDLRDRVVSAIAAELGEKRCQDDFLDLDITLRTRGRPRKDEKNSS